MAAAFRILGPLEVLDADRAVALGGGRQRALLAILLLRANQVVSTDQLIEGLWGESPPPTARQTVQVYVSQLRRVLPVDGLDGRTIETRAPGYLLHVGPGELDLDRFEALFAEGRTALAGGDAEHASEILREALGLWRGAPLADFTFEDFAQREIGRLDERRMACVEERIEADLAMGRHADLVAELEALVAEHPVRERLRGQLMVALYGSGRQAEALEVYAAGRRALADELGIEPGGALRELERRILNQDPSLAPAARPSPPAAPKTASPSRGWRGERALIAVGAAVVAIAVVALLVTLGGGDDATGTIPGNSVVAIDAGGGRAGAPVELGATPSELAVTDGAVWVGVTSDRTLRRIDTRSNATVDTIPLGSGPDGIAAGNGSVWVTNAFAGTVARVRPETNSVVQTITVPNGPHGVAVGDDAVWVTSLYARAVTRIDPDSGAKLGSTVVGGSPFGVAVGEGAVWVTNESDASVFRLNAGTGKVVQAIGVGTAPAPITVGAGSVWVGNTLDATVSRIDPATNRVTATIGVGEGPAALVASKDGIWVANELAGTLMRIDPRTNTVVETIPTGQRPAALALDGRRLWVAAQDASAAHRGGTLRVAVDEIGATVDQFDYSSLWQVNLTGDGLTAYRRVPGTQGATLVPDLAVAIPVPADGGRTYTFQIRRGLSYSNGDPVELGDFRRGIERFFRLGGGRTAPYYDVIVGAEACRARPARCDLSGGIVADAAAGTVTIRLTRPDPNMLHYLALPFAHAVARSAPATEVTTQGLPATGPYVVASHRPGRELRLVRNPKFREWSKAARPDGYPDEIVLTAAGGEQAAVTGVEQGRFDLTLSDLLSPEVLDRLSVQYPERLRSDPMVATLFVALNTTVPPFDSLDARRAVAYALDRAALVEMLGAAQYAQTTCQILPPNFPSYEAYCPFTRDPEEGGSWRAPDLEEARRLVAKSGTAGARVVVRTQGTFSEQAKHVAGVLRQLGYRATVRETSAEQWLADAYGPDTTKVQVGLTGWAIDYMAPSSFFEQLRCGTIDPARYCNPAIDRQIDEALALQATDPVAADRLWAQIDRSLTDQAPWIPYATPRVTRFTSSRLGNFQHHPVWHSLLDQMWVQ